MDTPEFTKQPETSNSFPSSDEPNPCVVIRGSHLSAISFRFHSKSEIQWQEAAPQPMGRYDVPGRRAGPEKLTLSQEASAIYPWPCVAQCCTVLLRDTSNSGSQTLLHIRLT